MPPVERVFEELVSQLPGYEPRPQQVQMARLITDAIEKGKHTLIEAGTGSGKSFGYLIPLLESGKTTVISTGTIALQEQLLAKDLPFLTQAYGKEIKVALAKGRSNYVCLRKLAEANQTLSPADPNRPAISSLIQLSVKRQWSGDRADLPFNLDSRFWSENLASDSEDCLGPKCPNYGFTPHRLARAALDEAQIIVANHALYFTDLAMEAGVLPAHDVVVFDEAHHLERTAVAAFSTHVARWMSGRLLQRAQRRFQAIPLKLIQEINDAEDALKDHLFRRGRGQYPLEGEPELGDRARTMSEALGRLGNWISATDAGQMLLLDDEPAMAKARAETVREQMQSVAQDLATRWDHFAALGRDPNRANWLYADPGKDQYDLTSAPLDVGQQLDEKLWQKRTCVLTSATLAVDGKFDFARRELGLPGDTIDAVLGSPFDFRNQALLYIPRALPAPNSPEYVDGLCPEIERILAVTNGHAFVLCTSYRVLRELAGKLMPVLTYPCKTQEDLPRARLVEWFKTTPNAVLFATATFWEGVDVPGDALSCVIIEKLPFASPDDPVVQARTDRMKSRGEDWFGGYMLPKAILALKQGFGRLIRTRTDRGLVALLDRRVLTMRYGEVVLRSLPPARRVSALPESLETGFATPTPSRREAGPLEPPREPVGAGGRWNAPPPDLDAVLGDPYA